MLKVPLLFYCIFVTVVRSVPITTKCVSEESILCFSSKKIFRIAASQEYTIIAFNQETVCPTLLSDTTLYNKWKCSSDNSPIPCDSCINWDFKKIWYENQFMVSMDGTLKTHLYHHLKLIAIGTAIAALLINLGLVTYSIIKKTPLIKAYITLPINIILNLIIIIEYTYLFVNLV